MVPQSCIGRQEIETSMTNIINVCMYVDECVNTHHFCTILIVKTRENTQECIKIMKISQESVLHVSNAKVSKTDEKRTKFAKLAVSVPHLSKVVKSSPWSF